MTMEGEAREAGKVEEGLGRVPLRGQDGKGGGFPGAGDVAVRGEIWDAEAGGEESEVGFEAALEAGKGGVVGQQMAEGGAGTGEGAADGRGRGEGGGGGGRGNQPGERDFGGELEPLAEVGGETAVAHGGAVGDGWGGVLKPFLEAATAGGKVASAVFVEGVEGGGGGFDGEELVTE